MVFFLTMLIKYSTTLPIPVPNELALGELAAKLPEGKLYTKNLAGQVVRINRGVFNLVDYPEYNETELFQNSVLKIGYVDEQLTLQTVLPFFRLVDIEGVEITYQYSFLAVNLDGTLNTSAIPSFKLMDLTEVLTSPLTASNHKYALTFQYSPTPIKNIAKDFYAEEEYGQWELLPEATKITEFEDVYKTIGYPEHIYLNLKAVGFLPPSDLQGYLLQVLGLDISLDKTPQLASHLDANAKSVFNLGYFTRHFDLAERTESISLDIANYDCFVASCRGTVIELNIDVISSVPLNSVKYVELTLLDFQGYVKFNSNLRFENGQMPVLTGVNTILTFMVYSVVDGITITCLQKNNNLSQTA